MRSVDLTALIVLAVDLGACGPGMPAKEQAALVTALRVAPGDEGSGELAARTLGADAGPDFYGPEMRAVLRVFGETSGAERAVEVRRALAPLVSALGCDPDALRATDGDLAALYAQRCPASGERLVAPDDAYGAEPYRALLALALERDARARGVASTELHAVVRAALLDAPALVLDHERLLQRGQVADWGTATRAVAVRSGQGLHVGPGTKVGRVIALLEALRDARPPDPKHTPSMRLVGHGLGPDTMAYLRAGSITAGVAGGESAARIEVSSDGVGLALDHRPFADDKLNAILRAQAEKQQVAHIDFEVVLAFAPERDFGEVLSVLPRLDAGSMGGIPILAAPKETPPPAPLLVADPAPEPPAPAPVVDDTPLPGPPAQVAIGRLHRSGGAGPNDESVARIFARRQAALQRCYEAALRQDPAAKGQVSLAFTIDDHGRVTAAEATADTTGKPALVECVTGVVGGWHLDPEEPPSSTYAVALTFSR